MSDNFTEAMSGLTRLSRLSHINVAGEPGLIPGA